MNCGTCLSLQRKEAYSQADPEKKFPLAGIGSLYCKRHSFEIVSLRYMPDYEASRYVCDNWKGKPIRVSPDTPSPAPHKPD